MTCKRTFFPFLISLLFLAVACVNPASGAVKKDASGPEQMLLKADQSRKTLLNSSKLVKNRQNWLNCTARYQDIYDKYPKSQQAPWAVYQAALLYRRLFMYSSKDADLDKAIVLCDTFLERYKDHQLADDAQFLKGDIYYNEKKDQAKAYVEFLKLDVQYPGGDMTQKAKGMIDELSNILGKKESVSEETKETKAVASSDGLVQIKNIRYWSTPTYTRVVIDADTQVKFSSNLLKEDASNKKPRRLYIDLENSRVSSEIESDITIKDGLLQGARAGQYNKNTVRVVLDINNLGDFKIFPLYDPFRIVIDVQGTGGQIKETQKQTASASDAGPASSSGAGPSEAKGPIASSSASSSTTSSASSTKASNTRTARKGIYKPDGADQDVSLARQLGLTVKTVVIDPGHGGKDPGTFLKGGVQEKDLTLDIAKRLAAKLKKEVGCDVLLTRDKDVFIPLDERTAFANVNSADLFISIHVNAHKKSSVYGLETYFLNMATDESAVIVAARENATSEKKISDLQSILNDLMLNTKISESSKLAYKVQDGIMSGVRKTYKVNKSLGVKQAPFYVLIGAKMPAVLIETGFISNPTEKKRLLSNSYKDILTNGIVTGVKSYIKSIDEAYNTGG
jgi:N-acetylmuramoyl-L-alanine amidase